MCSLPGFQLFRVHRWHNSCACAANCTKDSIKSTCAAKCVTLSRPQQQLSVHVYLMLSVRSNGRHKCSVAKRKVMPVCVLHNACRCHGLQILLSPPPVSPPPQHVMVSGREIRFCTKTCTTRHLSLSLPLCHKIKTTNLLLSISRMYKTCICAYANKNAFPLHVHAQQLTCTDQFMKSSLQSYSFSVIALIK